MNRQRLTANLKFHWMNLGYSLAVFWLVVGLVMALSVAINAMTDVTIGLFVSVTREGMREAVSVVAAAFPAITIYMIVISLVSQPENFSFLIGLGSSRKIFYSTQIMAVTFVALLNSLIHVTAFALESSILPMVGLQQLNYTEVYGLNLNFATLVMVQWLILTAMSAVLMVVAALFYRFRTRNVVIVLVALAAVSFSLGVDLWSQGFRWLASNASVWELSGKLLLVSIISWGVGWMVIRRTEAR